MSKVKKLSNYEFYKRIEKAAEREAANPKTPRGEKRLHKCEFCHRYSRTEVMVPSDLMGTYHEGCFRFKYLLTCNDCALHLQRLDINDKRNNTNEAHEDKNTKSIIPSGKLVNPIKRQYANTSALYSGACKDYG